MDTLHLDKQSLSVETKQSILAISALQFGERYLTESRLQSLLNVPNTIVKCEWSNDQLAGFSILMVLNRQTFREQVYLPEEWLNQHIPATAGCIGYRKMTVVHPDFENQGIGKRLFDSGEQFFEGRCECVLSSTWWKEDNQAIPHFLEAAGYEQKTIVDDYWTSDSIANGYDCVLCGNPCHCSAAIYLKHL